MNCVFKELEFYDTFQLHQTTAGCEKGDNDIFIYIWGGGQTDLGNAKTAPKFICPKALDFHVTVDLYTHLND